MSDGALDLLILVLCLAIVIPLGTSAVIPIAKEYNISKDDTIGDKSVPNVVGDLSKTDYNSDLDIFNVVLTTQVQDYCMPEPRKLSIPNPSCPNEDSHFKTPSEARSLGLTGGCYNTSSNSTPDCVDTKVIDITSMYKPDVLSYGSIVYTSLKNNYTGDNYEITLSYGRHDLDNDESYRIRKK